MLRVWILFIFSFFALTGFSQTITLNGKVMDEDGRPIRDARYYFANDPLNKKLTDSQGNFSITYQLGSFDTLWFEHVAYTQINLVMTTKMEKRAKNGGLYMDMTLPDRVIDMVEVRPNVPDTLFGTQEYSIADFEFDRSGDLVLLTYDKNLDKGSVLRVLDSNKVITDRYYIAEKAIELRSDFRGNIHLITEEMVYFIEVKNHKMNLFVENRDYFFRYVAPIVDTIGERIYFSNYSDVYPAFDYLEFNRQDSTYKNILKVEDQEMMDMYRAEFKYVDVRTKIWAHNKELETGIDKEIWVGATVFTNSIYYEPLYAPLFKVGEDSILVFDHYKDLLFHYSPESGFSDSLRINYHKEAKKSGWEQPLIQDEGNSKIYGIFLRNGYTYLIEIDKLTGLVAHSYRLHFKYIEEIHVKNGYVYYIYRPFESVQKKYIYKEKLD